VTGLYEITKNDIGMFHVKQLVTEVFCDKMKINVNMPSASFKLNLKLNRESMLMDWKLVENLRFNKKQGN